MNLNIILLYSLCCFLCADCDLEKEEGAACEWEGVRGTCANSRKCLTTLDDRSPKQPVCSQKGEETVICCTDCELVNDTRNAVISPMNGIYWKTGQKSWDKCLEYFDTLPYSCRGTGYGGIKRQLDEANKCHKYDLYAVSGSPPPGSEHPTKYPHMALLGYGEVLETATWLCGGSIISEKYVLTVAHCTSSTHAPPLKYVAYGISNQAKAGQTAQHVGIRRVIRHPDFKPPQKYNDIALIEVETPITFNKDVLPACLHVSPDAYDDEVEAPMWVPREKEEDLSLNNNVVSAITMKKYNQVECSKEYPTHRHLQQGIDANSQVCYGDKDRRTWSCKGGEPLVIKTQISSCLDTVVGLSAFGRLCKGEHESDVYTKVSYYVPWIESVVWD